MVYGANHMEKASPFPGFSASLSTKGMHPQNRTQEHTSYYTQQLGTNPGLAPPGPYSPTGQLPLAKPSTD